MTVEISSHLLNRLREIAAKSPDQEVCGLLYGSPNRIEDFIEARNVAETPATHFEVDPIVLLDAHRAARHDGPAVIGHWHSHPKGPAEPSAEDARCASGDGALWIILGRDDVRCWRAQEDGRWHGRFEQVALAVV